MTNVYLPLYEAKMLSFYDHRAADVIKSPTAQHRQNQPRYLTDAEKDDPNREAIGLYWIAEEHVSGALEGRWDRDWVLGWRDISSASNHRTMIPSIAPASGFGDKFLLCMADRPSSNLPLAAVWSSFAFDYVARQKVSGTSVKFFTVKQFACPTPAQLAGPSPWNAADEVSEQLSASVKELSVTSWRMVPFARDLGDDGPPFRWIPERREQIRAEVDAMMFHVYGLDRDEVDYVMDTFTVLRKYDVRDHGEFRTKRLILEFYDLLAEAIASSVPYESPISPTPGFGPRHDESTRPYWMKEEQ